MLKEKDQEIDIGTPYTAVRLRSGWISDLLIPRSTKNWLRPTQGGRVKSELQLLEKSGAPRRVTSTRSPEPHSARFRLLGEDNTEGVLPDGVVEMVHQITTNPSVLGKQWFNRMMSHGAEQTTALKPWAFSSERTVSMRTAVVLVLGYVVFLQL